MLKLIIGNKTYSSWSLRGWLACKQSGLPFAEAVVQLYGEGWDTRQQADDLRPSAGKVPILWDGDFAVWDSLAILDYLDLLSGGGRFWPEERAALALARSMCAEMHSGYMALRSEHCMNLRQVYPARAPSAAVAADIDRIIALWSQARTHHGHGGAFLFGDFGAADIMFAPVVTRLATYALPVPGDARAYMDAVLAHPFMTQWLVEAAAEPWVIERFERPELL